MTLTYISNPRIVRKGVFWGVYKGGSLYTITSGPYTGLLAGSIKIAEPVSRWMGYISPQEMPRDIPIHPSIPFSMVGITDLTQLTVDSSMVMVDVFSSGVFPGIASKMTLLGNITTGLTQEQRIEVAGRFIVDWQLSCGYQRIYPWQQFEEIWML